MAILSHISNGIYWDANKSLPFQKAMSMSEKTCWPLEITHGLRTPNEAFLN